jgi:hypothetical protein
VPAAVAQTQTAVEYYYAAWDQYFVTSSPDEIAALDGGAFGGVCQRTGQTFTVWSQPVGGVQDRTSAIPRRATTAIAKAKASGYAATFSAASRPAASCCAMRRS